MGKKKKSLIFSKEVSLHITPVSHSLTESESGKDSWVFLFQCCCCLLIVINEMKCPDSVLWVLLVFVGASSCPDPAEYAEAKSCTSSSRKSCLLKMGIFTRERHQGCPTKLGLKHFFHSWKRLCQHSCGSNNTSKRIASSGHPAKGRRSRMFAEGGSRGEAGRALWRSPGWNSHCSHPAMAVSSTELPPSLCLD